MSNYNGSSSKSKNVALYIFFIAALLLVNGIIFYYNYQVRKENVALKEQTISLEEEKNKLQIEYNETIAELENVQIANTNLSEQLTDLQGEIDDQKGKIDDLLRKGNLSKKELGKARGLIEQLRANSNNYLAQIEQLELANLRLSEENTNLEQNIVIKDAEKKVLEEEKEELISAKTELEGEKEELTQIVKAAQILVSDNITGLGMKVKNNNKRVQTDNAKKVDELNICFDVMPNTAVDAETQDVFIRILNPEGVTLALGKGGSGKFQLASSEQTLNYTLKKSVRKFESKQNYCATWVQETDFGPGIYAIEVYHLGHKIGNNTFELKKGIL